MRTRSKLSLNDTPLETIEQAFIPPDITEDMYDSACENDEWMEFLSEFTKPLGLLFIILFGRMIYIHGLCKLYLNIKYYI